MAAPRILVTRSPHQASALAEALRAVGLDPILIPTIELAPPTTFAPLDEAIATLGTYHWLLFTSANAVESFAVRLRLIQQNSVILSEAQRSRRACPELVEGTPTEPESPLPPEPFSPRLPPHLKIAAIGPSTARACEDPKLLGTKPTLIPQQAVAESLATALLPYALQPDGTPTRFLLIRAEVARDHLPDALSLAGAHVTIAPAYRTVIPASSISTIRTLFSAPHHYPDAITFTSSSTATNLLALLEVSGLTLPPDILRISIGPITSNTLRDLQLPAHAEANEPTVPSLMEKTLQTISKRNLHFQ